MESKENKIKEIECKENKIKENVLGDERDKVRGPISI